MDFLTIRLISIASLLAQCSATTTREMHAILDLAKDSLPDTTTGHLVFIDRFLDVAMSPNRPNLPALDNDILLAAHMVMKRHREFLETRAGKNLMASSNNAHINVRTQLLEAIINGEDLTEATTSIIDGLTMNFGQNGVGHVRLAVKSPTAEIWIDRYADHWSEKKPGGFYATITFVDRHMSNFVGTDLSEMKRWVKTQLSDAVDRAAA